MRMQRGDSYPSSPSSPHEGHKAGWLWGQGIKFFFFFFTLIFFISVPGPEGKREKKKKLNTAECKRNLWAAAR